MSDKKENEEKTVENIHTVHAKIEGDVWENAILKAFKKKSKNVKTDGFRKGKVPRHIYDKRFGKDYLVDAANLVVQDAYQIAIDDSSLKPIVFPEVSIVSIDDDSVEFQFTITTKPEVVIKQYKNLGVSPEEVEITDQEVDSEIDRLLEQFTEVVSKDGEIQEGDFAVIDYEGFKDGDAFDGGKGENYSLEIGSHTFIPGFEEKLIGRKAGDEFDIELTFPDDYFQEDLAGSDVVFHVKVHEVKERVKRELDSDFFLDLDMEGVHDEKSLREHIIKNLKEQREYQVEEDYIHRLLDEVAKHVEVDIPDQLVEEEIDRMIHNFEHQLYHQGLTLDLYYKFSQSSEKDLRAQMSTEAYQNILYRFMLEEIMELENVSVTDSEMEEEVKKIAEENNEEYDEALKEMGGRDAALYDLRIRKTVDLLKELNKE